MPVSGLYKNGQAGSQAWTEERLKARSFAAELFATDRLKVK